MSIYCVLYVLAPEMLLVYVIMFLEIRSERQYCNPPVLVSMTRGKRDRPGVDDLKHRPDIPLWRFVHTHLVVARRSKRGNVESLSFFETRDIFS